MRAFREEVAREVRPAEFSDLRELIQGLSTGVQAELEKPGKPARRSPGRGPGAAAGTTADVPGRAGGAAR